MESGFGAGREESTAAAVGQLAGTSFLLRTTACLLAGRRLIAETSIKVFLANYAATARVEDCCLAYSQLAYSTAERLGYKAGVEVSSVTLPHDQSYHFKHRESFMLEIHIFHTRRFHLANYSVRD